MRKIEDYLDFVKDQVQVQDRLSTKYGDEPYRHNMHVKAKKNFAELARIS